MDDFSSRRWDFRSRHSPKKIYIIMVVKGKHNYNIHIPCTIWKVFYIRVSVYMLTGQWRNNFMKNNDSRIAKHNNNLLYVSHPWISHSAFSFSWHWWLGSLVKEDADRSNFLMMFLLRIKNIVIAHNLGCPCNLGSCSLTRLLSLFWPNNSWFSSPSKHLFCGIS